MPLEIAKDVPVLVIDNYLIIYAIFWISPVQKTDAKHGRPRGTHAGPAVTKKSVRNGVARGFGGERREAARVFSFPRESALELHAREFLVGLEHLAAHRAGELHCHARLLHGDHEFVDVLAPAGGEIVDGLRLGRLKFIDAVERACDRIGEAVLRRDRDMLLLRVADEIRLGAEVLGAVDAVAQERLVQRARKERLLADGRALPEGAVHLVEVLTRFCICPHARCLNDHCLLPRGPSLFPCPSKNRYDLPISRALLNMPLMASTVVTLAS